MFLSFALLKYMNISPVEQFQRFASVLLMYAAHFPSWRKDVKWRVSKMESVKMTTHPMFFISALVLFYYFTPPFFFFPSTFSEFTPFNAILLLLSSITALS